MHESEKSRLSIFAAVAFALAAIAAFAILAPRRPPLPIVTLPTPNGYETLAEAGATVVGIPNDFDETTDVEALRACVDANARAFDGITKAATQDYAVPIDYQKGMQGVIDSMNHQQIRPAMRLMMVKARLAELEEDYATAAETQVSLLDHAEKIANEGVLVHVQVSLAYQGAALEGLIRLAPKLSQEAKAATLATLQESKHPRMSIDAIQAREEALSFKDAGLIQRWQFSRLRKLAAPTYVQLKAQRAKAEVERQEVLALLAE